MMSNEGLGELMNQIRALGYDEDTAANYAALIGDTPVRDQEGNIVVMDGERVLAVLKGLKYFNR